MTNVVDRGEPFQFTTEVEKKFIPFTVSVNAPEPAAVVLGSRVLASGAVAVTVKTSAAADVPPPGLGLKTVIEKVPGVLRRPLDIVAFNSLPLTNVVGNGVPFHSAKALVAKLTPRTSSVTGPDPEIAVADGM